MLNEDHIDCSDMRERVNIALDRFLHNNGNIPTEGSLKTGLCPGVETNARGEWRFVRAGKYQLSYTSPAGKCRFCWIP